MFSFKSLRLTILFLIFNISLLMGQLSMQNSTSSSAGKIINSTTYNINFSFGQSTAIGNMASGNFNLSAGFTNTISNIFRTVNLIFPKDFQILLSGSSHQIIL